MDKFVDEKKSLVQTSFKDQVYHLDSAKKKRLQTSFLMGLYKNSIMYKRHQLVLRGN